MAAKLPLKAAIKAIAQPVAVPGSQTSTKGNSLIVGAGYKLAGVPMSVPPKNRPWIPGWHPSHPANQ